MSDRGGEGDNECCHKDGPGREKLRYYKMKEANDKQQDIRNGQLMKTGEPVGRANRIRGKETRRAGTVVNIGSSATSRASKTLMLSQHRGRALEDSVGPNQSRF